MTEVPKRRLLVWPLLVALLTILADQVSKCFAVRFLGPAASIHSVPLIGSTVRLAYLENTGVSFGRLQGYSTWITLVTGVVVVGLLIGYRSLLTPSRWANLALGLILGGATGNLIDRIVTALRLGLANAYVVDFVDVSFWAVFNLADGAITVGGIIYALYLLFRRERPATRDHPEEKPCPSQEQQPREG